MPESADSKRAPLHWETIIAVAPILIILEVVVAIVFGVAPLFSMPELRAPAILAGVLLLLVCLGLNLFQDLQGRPRALTGMGVVACMFVLLAHPFIGLLSAGTSVYRDAGRVVVADMGFWVTVEPSVTVYGAIPYTRTRHRDQSPSLILPTDGELSSKWTP